MFNGIKALVFDHGGVLTKGGGHGTNERAAAQAMGLSESIKVPRFSDALKRGIITNEQYVAEVNSQYPNAPRPLTNRVWWQIYLQLQRDANAYEFVRKCQRAGLRTGLLTTINFTVARMLEDDGSYDCFDFTVLSCYAQCAKPDDEIYAIVEARLPGVEPQEILFLDDQQQHLDAAARRGWQTLLVTSPEQMVRDAGRRLGIR